MKKTLLSLGLMLAACGAWAQGTAITDLTGLNNTSFYTIKSVNRGFLYYDSSKGNYVTSSSQTAVVDATPANNGTTPTEQFAFLHTEAMAAGEYYLYNQSAEKFVSYTGGRVTLTANPECSWTVTKVDNSFTIKVPGTSQTYINITHTATGGCNVASTAPDNGNKMTLTNVLSNETEANKALAKIESYRTETLWPQVQALKATPTGLGYPKTTSAAYTALRALPATASVSAMIAAINNFVYCEDIEKPVAGKAYVIKAWWKSRQLPFSFFATAVSGVYAGYDNGYAPKEGATDAEVAKFVCQVVDGKYSFISDNGYYMGIQADGKGNKTAQTYNTNQLLNLVSANWASRGKLNSALTTADLMGKFCLKGPASDNNVNHNMMYSYSSKNFHNENAGNTPYADNGMTVYYTIEEATDYTTNVVKVNAASNIAGINGICTYSAPYAVTLPTGYQAWYVAAAPEGGKVALTAVEDGLAIPANAGVLITGAAAAEGVTLLPATSETQDLLSGNQLVGTGNDGKTLAAGDYILTDGKFYPIDPANAAVAAHKAYLHTTGAGAPSLVLNFGETDAIKAVESVKGQKAPIYDMQGRRVQKAGKGLYIQGGKKFMVK